MQLYGSSAANKSSIDALLSNTPLFSSQFLPKPPRRLEPGLHKVQSAKPEGGGMAVLLNTPVVKA
jgi:hypothetical protein